MIKASRAFIMPIINIDEPSKSSQSLILTTKCYSVRIAVSDPDFLSVGDDDGQQGFNRLYRHWVGRCALLGCVVCTASLGWLAYSALDTFMLHCYGICNRCFSAILLFCRLKCLLYEATVDVTGTYAMHSFLLNMVDINLYVNYIN